MFGAECTTASFIKSSYHICSAKVEAFQHSSAQRGQFCKLAIITEDGKEKKVTIDLSHLRPHTSLYICINKVHIEALDRFLNLMTSLPSQLWIETESFLAVEVSMLMKDFTNSFVYLPKEHGRGRQLAQRLARPQMEIGTTMFD